MGKIIKQDIFADFSRKAKEVLEKKKQQRKEKLYIKDLDMTITVHGLTEQEFLECTDFSEDPIENDYFLIYAACEEMQESAEALIQEGIIKKHYEIAKMLSPAVKKAVINEIIHLSGLDGDAGIEVLSETEEIKN